MSKPGDVLYDDGNRKVVVADTSRQGTNNDIIFSLLGMSERELVYNIRQNVDGKYDDWYKNEAAVEK